VSLASNADSAVRSGGCARLVPCGAFSVGCSSSACRQMKRRVPLTIVSGLLRSRLVIAATCRNAVSQKSCTLPSFVIFSFLNSLLLRWIHKLVIHTLLRIRQSRFHSAAYSCSSSGCSFLSHTRVCSENLGALRPAHAAEKRVFLSPQAHHRSHNCCSTTRGCQPRASSVYD
jgi:hypothetical protein